MANADDVQSEITPEDFDGEQTPQAESSPAEEAEDKPEAEQSEAKDTKEAEKPVPPDVPTKDDSEEEESQDEPEAESEDKPKGENEVAEKRKNELNTEIRDLVSQRNALKREVEQANQVYQPATEEELVDGGLTELEAKVESMRQQQEVERYNSQVADAQLTLASESERVLNDFPIFNPDSEQYDKELAEEAAGLLEAALVIDPNTEQVVGSNVSPYKLYQTLAKANGISGVKGQLKGQQAAEKQLANADNAPSAAPAQKPKDPLTELFADL